MLNCDWQQLLTAATMRGPVPLQPGTYEAVQYGTATRTSTCTSNGFLALSGLPCLAYLPGTPLPNNPYPHPHRPPALPTARWPQPARPASPSHTCVHNPHLGPACLLRVLRTPPAPAQGPQSRRPAALKHWNPSNLPSPFLPPSKHPGQHPTPKPHPQYVFLLSKFRTL